MKKNLWRWWVVWKQECGDQKLSRKKKKPNSWKYCLWSDWLKSSNLGWKSKICDNGCMKNKKEAKNGDPKERLNEVESKSCVRIARGWGWQVEAVLGQPGWSWISSRYQQNTHTCTHIHTNNHYSCEFVIPPSKHGSRLQVWLWSL
jgi:hypothetical protein